MSADKKRPPVIDWATDFDHTDSAWVSDPYPIWEELRRACPVAHSDRYGGTWLPVRHEDIAAVAYDTEHFTSRSVVVSEVRPAPDDPPARCMGSNLARMELRVALEEWLARYPAFELVDPALVTWSAGQVRGPRALPVRILG
jgi:cytochrome P450